MTQSDPRHQRIAELLGDRYELLDLLGKGGFAAVYRARNLRLHRIEALKVLSEALTEDPDFARRFEQEARVAAALDHPNIVKIYDYGAIREFCWYSMQFIEGSTLAHELKSQGRLEERNAARIASGLLDALAYSHARGVIHRDIKPDNVLLDSDGRPYLTDFGVAKSELALVKTHAGTLLGSPAYMSPEQVQGKPLDGRSDVYSLGITLYKTLAGELPFSGDDTFRATIRRLSEPAPPLSSKRRVHPALDAIVMRALERDPAARFARARDMRDALEEFLAHASPPTDDVEDDATLVLGRTEKARGETPPGVPARDSAAAPLAPPGVGAPPVSPATELGPAAPGRPKRWVIPAIGAIVLLLAALLLLRGAATSPRASGRPNAVTPPAPAARSPIPTGAPVVAATMVPSSAPTAVAPTRTPEEEVAIPTVIPTRPAARRRTPTAAPVSVAPVPTAETASPPPGPTNPPFDPNRARFPPEIEAQAPFLLSAQARAAHAGEAVGLSVTVGTDGRVKSARVISDVCPECDRAALESVRRFRFRPARNAAGNPIEAAIAISIRIPQP